MTTPETAAVRLASVPDARLVAQLLHAFNTEFETPTPGVEILTARLADLLAGQSTFAIVAGDYGVAVVTLRPNVWFDGPVALLDELYVTPAQRNHRVGSMLIEAVHDQCRQRGVEYIEINVDADDVDAQRFYRRHGYADIDPDTGLPAYYFSREL